MYAKVENNQVVKMNSSLGVFGIAANSTVAEREAQGVYEVVYDNSNLKNTRYYWNGAESIVFANNTVTASYATAIGKDVEDALWTQQDSDDGVMPSSASVGDVKAKGLKSLFKDEVKVQAKNLLSPSDWYITRKAEDSESTIPSNVSTYRAAVRTKSGEMETAIDGAADAAAMEALYTYTNTGTEEEPVYTRPLGEWPVLS